LGSIHPENAMDIKTERSLLIKELQQVDDLSLLQAIKVMLHYGRISIEQYNRELNEAEERIDRGDFFTQEEVEKMAKEW
jgi:hypothetical protein